MPETTLTAEQCDALAHGCLDASDAIDRRLIDEWKSLSKAERRQLRDASEMLRAQASELTLQAVGLDLSAKNLGVRQLSEATARGVRALRRLDSVAQVLRVATALVGLANRVSSRDVSGSLGALETLMKAIG